jgi:hypothetical protein
VVADAHNGVAVIAPRDGHELFERMDAAMPEDLEDFEPESWGAFALLSRALSPRLYVGAVAFLLTSATFLFNPLPFDLALLGLPLRQLLLAAIAVWTLRPAYQLMRLSDEELAATHHPDPPPP